MCKESISRILYSPGGNIFCVVTGKVVQVFESYGTGDGKGSEGRSGGPTLLSVLLAR